MVGRTGMRIRGCELQSFKVSGLQRFNMKAGSREIFETLKL